MMFGAEVYNDVADILEREGWCKGFYDNGSGRCLIGAFRKVMGLNCKVATVLDNDFAKELGFLYYTDVARWNDAQPTSEPVIDLLRAKAVEIGEPQKEIEIPDWAVPDKEPIEHPEPITVPEEDPDRELVPV